MKLNELTGRHLYLVVIMITVIGMSLRLWGINWSLPDQRHPIATYHPDELVNLAAAQSADISHGKFDVGFYNYGAFYFYLVGISHSVGRVYHFIPSTQPVPGQALSDVEALKAQAPEQAGRFLMGRLVTAIMGTLTIPVVFAFGRRLYSASAGLLASLLYASAPLAVLHAHFLTVDVPATLFVTLALLYAAKIHSGGGWKDILIAACWTGMAAATKYTAVVCAIAPLTALALQAAGRPSEERWHAVRMAVLMAAVFICASVIVFLAGCPGPLINWSAFWNGSYPDSGVRYELLVHARTGHGYLFVNTDPGWWYHLTVSLRYGLGTPLLLLTLAGVAYALRRRVPGDLLLLIFLGVAFVSTSFSAVRFARYMIPMYPALCLVAARVVVDLRNSLYARRAWITAGALTAISCLATSVGLSRTMSQRDARDLAADYLAAKAMPHATVGFAHVPWFYSPPLSPYWGAVVANVRKTSAPDPPIFDFRMPDSDWDQQVLHPMPDYIVLSNFEVGTEWKRLKLAPAVEFMKLIPEDSAQTRFLPSLVPFISPDDPDAPQDLLYVLPAITIYAPPRTMVH